MVECCICLDPCIHNSIRAPATLICGHQFHLACIGSAFNFKGVMECPICQTRENSEWKYCSGDPSRPCPRINEDSESTDPSDEDNDESEELESPKKKPAKRMTAREYIKQFKFKKTNFVKFSTKESFSDDDEDESKDSSDDDDDESKDSSDDDADISDDENEELESPEKKPAQRMTAREFRILLNKRKKAKENSKQISSEAKESSSSDEDFSDDENEESPEKPARRMTAREYAKLFKKKKKRQVVSTEENSKLVSHELKESSDDDADLSDDENEEMESPEKKPAKRMNACEYAKLIKKNKTSHVKEASNEENSNPNLCESLPKNSYQNMVEENVIEASEPIYSIPNTYASTKRAISDVGVVSGDQSNEEEDSPAKNGSQWKKRKTE